MDRSQGLTRQRADDIVQLVYAGFTGRLQDPGVTQLKEVEDLPASTQKARSIAIVVWYTPRVGSP